VIVTRRQILRTAGGLLPALLLPAAPRAEKAVEIAMRGRSDGSHVWFDPVGIRLHPGQTVLWINLDPGNAHTATAYHPANFGRPRRIPERAAPWNSDYLLPNETFGVVLARPGVYDFYCVPHEHAGMVGRIVVGAPDSHGRPGDQTAAGGEGALPEAAMNGFPSVDEIMRKGIVRRV
jgi:plastocyanin